MKNLFFLISIFTYQCVISQTITLPLRAGLEDNTQGAYYKDIANELDQFVGSWLYTEGNKKYTIDFKKLIKKEFIWGQHYFEDVLVGGFKIVANNTTLHNSIANQYEYSTTLRGSGFFKNQNKYDIIFEDPLNCDIHGSVTIEIDPNNSNKMIWNMTRDEIFYDIEKCPELRHLDSETSTFGQIMSLPYQMILTKIQNTRTRE